MITRILIALLVLNGMAGSILTIETAQGAEPLSGTYSLDDIVALAVERSPAMAGAEGFVKQSHGQQIAAGASQQADGLNRSSESVIERQPAIGD